MVFGLGRCTGRELCDFYERNQRPDDRSADDLRLCCPREAGEPVRAIPRCVFGRLHRPSPVCAALAPESNTQLMFNGNPGLTLAKGASAYSDPVTFQVTAFTRYAISLDVTSASDISVHLLGLVTNYMAMGAHASDSAANAFTAIPNFDPNPDQGPQFPFY